MKYIVKYEARVEVYRVYINEVEAESEEEALKQGEALLETMEMYEDGPSYEEEMGTTSWEMSVDEADEDEEVEAA